jgi:predicted metal-dependent hydrolase
LSAAQNCWNLHAAAVVRGRFKYLRVSVREGRVRVSCPTRVSNSELTRFIDANLEKVATWMHRQKIVLENRRRANPMSALLCDGGRVAYEGNVLTLRCDPNIDRTRLSEDAKELCVKFASREDVSAAVQKWLKARFAERMAERVSYWVNKTGLQPKKVSASNAKTLWGSCSRNGSVRLSWRLICLPPAVLDYIIVHELVHLRHFDHSKAFWEEVNVIYPETPSVRRYLKNVRAADLF